MIGLTAAENEVDGFTLDGHPRRRAIRRRAR